MDTGSRIIPALPDKDAGSLARALEAGDVTVFVDGTALRLPPAARDAVLDLLARLGRGHSVAVTDVPDDPGAAASGPRSGSGAHAGPALRPTSVPSPLLTTSQAAAAAGISHTYLRNLTDAGVIPVEYRGSHRRIRMEDIEAWLEQQRAREARSSQGRPSPPAQDTGA